MIYLKSIIAGVGAVVLTVLLATLGFVVWGWWWVSQRASSAAGVGAVSYDVNSPWIGIPIVMVVMAAFAVGFSWEFRRATRASR